MPGQPGFFDRERYAALSAAGDSLERLAAVVDFELFRDELDAALDRADRTRGGRPPYDAVLMFKVLVLQTLYTLSDDQTEYQMRDRLSFMRFLDLALEDRVPDAKTIWLFREQLTRAGIRTFAVTDAAAHDGRQLGKLLDRHNTASPAGPTALVARRPTLLCWHDAGWCRISSSRTRAAGRCRGILRAAMPAGRGSGSPSSTSSPLRSAASVWSSARSASPRHHQARARHLVTNMRRLAWFETRLAPV